MNARAHAAIKTLPSLKDVNHKTLFSENMCQTELEETAPVFYDCLQAATICRETRKK